MVDKLILRTSDRVTFRRCRQAWDFGSKIRLNWDYVPGVEALDFGTAIHAGLETYYDPVRWRQDRLVVQQESILAFVECMVDWRKRLKRSEQWDQLENDWHNLDELGRGMLNHFFIWAPKHDTYWEPVKVEIEFEVPIPVPYGFSLPSDFYRVDGVLWRENTPVVYQGRIDLIVRDTRNDKYYIVDHKTTGQFGSYEHLELDTQVSSYAWAIKKVIGIDVAGVIFQEVKKKAPVKPKVLKNGSLSRDKSQNTTPELYRLAVVEQGLNLAEYIDFINFLESSENEYFRRIQVDRTAKELDIVETHVLNEALDMFGDPRIYPNPNRFNCGSCKFHDPCIMKQDGSDWEFFLEHSLLYEKRK
jgi:hypothetical protein